MTTNYVYVLNPAVIGYSKDVNGNPVYYYSVLKDGVKTVIACSNTKASDGVGVYAYALDENAFVSDEPNSVESGEYTLDTPNAGTVATGVKVGVITNNTVFATVDPAADPNQYVITPDTVIADTTTDPVTAKDATLATGDTVTVVYAKSGDLYVAKSIYITAHAADGTAGDTTAPAVTVEVNDSTTINGQASGSGAAQALTAVGNNDTKNTVAGASATTTFKIKADKAANTRITVYVSGAGKAVSTTEFGNTNDCEATYSVVAGDSKGIVTVVVTAQTEGHRPVSTTYKLEMNQIGG